jgi:hypothetical protein
LWSRSAAVTAIYHSAATVENSPAISEAGSENRNIYKAKKIIREEQAIVPPFFYFVDMKTMIALLLFMTVAETQTLPLPPRNPGAPAGSQFYSIIASLSRQAREDTVFKHIAAGNIPGFLRTLVPVTTNRTINSTAYTLQYYVTPDYLAVGSDADYFLMPMTPILAQKIANLTACTMPTAKMADQIYTTAAVKLRPQPIPWDAEMVNAPRFWQHNDSVKALRNPILGTYPLGSLVGGTKKDVVIDKKIYSWIKSTVPKPVVIYGWHQLNGTPIQPTYNGHGETYADYSHGIRLVQRMGKINGAEISLIDIMKDPVYYSIIADTVLVKQYYGSLTQADDESSLMPEEFELFQNYPNPFNPETRFRFSLATAGPVKLSLFDTLGKEIAEVIDQDLSAGNYEISFSNREANLSSGMYFYRLQAGSRSQTKKMVLLQ